MDQINTYECKGKETLKGLIQTIPMDEKSIIILIHSTGRTKYTFPAVINSNGGEIFTHYTTDNRVKFKAPEDHRIWQIKRRLKITRQINRIAKRVFE